MNRRTFLASAAMTSAASTAAAAPPPFPIVDTHIHLYDPSRPQGVPWPPKTNTMIYKTTLPSRLREVSKGLGITAAIEVECSPWLEDNQWVLDVAAKDPIIVGMVGNLEPSKPDFRKNLDRFRKNPLFLGIRYGYLWDRDLGKELTKPEFIAGLKEMAAEGMSLDTANPSIRVLTDIIKITDAVPNLRIIIDHLPALVVPRSSPERAAFDSHLKALSKRPQVYVKVSAVLRKLDDKPVSLRLADHKEKIDILWDAFGPDRLLYGSDWPNSEPSAPYPQVLAIVREYFEGKGREAAEKYFWKNSVKAYRWKRRDPSQPMGA